MSAGYHVETPYVRGYADQIEANAGHLRGMQSYLVANAGSTEGLNGLLSDMANSCRRVFQWQNQILDEMSGRLTDTSAALIRTARDYDSAEARNAASLGEAYRGDAVSRVEQRQAEKSVSS